MRKFASLVVATLVLGVVPFVTPAAADHTDPNIPLSNAVPIPGDHSVGGIETGEGEWVGITRFLQNPGSDIKFFTKPVPIPGGTRTDLFASSGTLGQNRDPATEQPVPAVESDWVGQRFTKLMEGSNVNVSWRADHGSAHCEPANTGVLSLQHDAAATGVPIMRFGAEVINNPKIVIDNTDTSGRCHDAPGGGLEFIDVSKLGDPNFEPREIHLTAHAGTSHTVTVDATRPWIVYNSSSEFDNMPWIDVLNIKSCLLPDSASLEQRREQCRPKVYRIPFVDEDGGFNQNTPPESPWSQARDVWYDLLTEDSSTCHDITARPGRIYCAGLNATLIFDVRNLTDANGNIRGRPLPCVVRDANPPTDVDVLGGTGAKVTDCQADPDANNATPNPFLQKAPDGRMATGWKFLGNFNHAGRDCTHPHDVSDPPDDPDERRSPNTQCNSNNYIDSSAGISVDHQSEPDSTGRYLVETDERGGGVVPGGATCSPILDNPVGNGGAHFFDITRLPNIRRARMPGPANAPATYIGEPVVPSPTFCDIHMIHFVHGRQRFVAAYYSQGVKIVDYFIDANGKITFDEVAGFVPSQGANHWVSNIFKIENHSTPQGTDCPNAPCVTYHFMASDIDHGIFVYKWTGPQAKAVHRAGTGGGDNGGGDDDDDGDRAANTALGGAAVVLLPAAMWLRRRRLNGRH